FAAAMVMAVVGVLNTSVPIMIGKLIQEMQRSLESGLNRTALISISVLYLGAIAIAYLLREFLKVVQSFLVENSCTRIEKVMTAKVVGHLMRVDLSTLTHEKVGALHGRITRSIVGFSRFLRLLFMSL